MSLAYRVMYRLGFTPWEQQDPVAPLADLVTGPRALQPGQALDIGCGTGQSAVFCASNGWRVTGVDDVPLALKRAAARAARRGVEVSLVRADIARTTLDRIGGGYDLLYDIGCLHNLAPSTWPGVGELLTAAANPGATLLMFVFARGGPKPGPVGMDAEDVTAMLPAWETALSRPAHEVTLPGRMSKAQPYFYQLVRN